MKRIIVTKNLVGDLRKEVTAAGILLSVLLFIVLSIFLTISSGCEGAKPKQRPDTDPSIIQITPAVTTPDAAKPEAKNPADQPKTEEPKATPKEVTEAKTEPPKNVEVNKPERVVNAEVGAGQKGHYGGEKTVMAPLLVPLGVYWRASEMTTYNIKIPKAMQLYKANHDNNAPATHEEFMEEIIKKEAIKLPQLPAGHRYFYDPTDEQLKIAKPAN
ncbi:MAG: hypothetical protein LBL39_03890 [Planctomycetaceae bacterium]|jgi:hypothetical protein|nr:hypothetical protein [Planctomycetaceae bacterium]